MKHTRPDRRTRHQAATDAPGRACILTDLDGRITSCSPAARRLLGRGDLAGMHLDDLFEVSTGRAGRMMKQHWRRDEIQIRRGDATVHVRIEETPLWDGDGQPSGSLLVLSSSDSAEVDLLRGLLDRAQDAFFVLEPSGVVVDVNHTACKALGMARDEILGRSIADLDAEASDWTARLDGALGDDEQAFPLLMRRHDGDPLPMRCELHPVEASQDGRVVLVARDSSQHRRVEEELRVTAERLNTAQEVARIGSWELDLVNNELWWSDQNYRIFGLEPDGFAASYESFLERIHPEDRDMVNEVYQDSIETRIPYAIDHRLLFPDGRIKWVHERCETIYDADGTPLRSIGTTQDITEQKMLELERKAIHRRYEDLLQHAADAILLVDGDGVIRFANQRVQDTFGYMPHELLGQSFEVLVPALQQDTHMWRRQASSERSPHRSLGEGIDLHAQRKDGSQLPVDVSLNPMDSVDGRMVMATVRDISDRKAAEAAEKAQLELQHLREIDDRLRDFINAAAHDLKQPLTPMQYALINLELMLGDLDAAPQRSLRIVQRNLERMNLLVQDLLDVARLESGTLEYSLEPVDLDQVIDETREFFEAHAAKEEVTLRVEASGLTVQADRRRLLQVLFNLVGNALKFTPSGGEVAVRVAAEGQAARINVTDTGPGLGREQMERLFQPFVQVHEPTPDAPKGTGLGLYISKGIIEQHGGAIGVQSDGPGQGATFWFTLPQSDGST